MRRSPAAATGLAVLALAPAAPAAAKDGDVRLQARLASCTTGVEPDARAATFTASLPRRHGADRLQLRFTLHQRLGRKGRFRQVRGVKGWNRWETSDPGRAGFVLTRRVEALAAPAAYRAVVRFRWLRADGSVVRTTRRTTRTCTQPDPRPDLRLGRLSAVAEGPGARYALGVRNVGVGAAKAFRVVLLVDGREQPAVAAGPLAGSETRTVHVVAPRCTPGSVVEVLLDADGAVDEAREADNAVRRPCPLP